jgi:hypothetical protein
MIPRARRASLLVALSVLTSAATAYAEGLWILSFPDKDTCEAFKEKAQSPSFAEWKAQRDTGKAPVRPVYTCEHVAQWERDKDGKLRRVPDTVDPRGPKGK